MGKPFWMQIDGSKNTVLRMGQIGFRNQKEFNDGKTTSVRISPGIGYQFDDHIKAGVQFNVAATKFDDAILNIPDSKNSILRAGPFVLYTQKLSDVFFVFRQLEGNYLYSKQKFGNTTIAKSNGVSGNIFLAVAINVHKGFALNFNFGGIGYATLKFDDSDSRQNSFSANFGDQLNFGISKNF